MRRACLTASLLVLSCSARPPLTEDSGTACSSPQVRCGADCATLATDDAHCGACAVACAATESCAGGACYPRACGGVTCPATHVCISGLCVDRSCFGVACPAGQRCGGGACLPADCSALTCALDEVCVSDACVAAACVGVLCPPGTRCVQGVCALNTCQTGLKDGDETDLDCGGPACPRCPDNGSCLKPTDCRSLVCTSGRCAAPACGDGVRNGGEGDVDCGGACPPCNDGQHCTMGAQCRSGVCVNGTCAGATCTNRVKNGAETALDCGGGTCPACPNGEGCATPADCASSRCVGNLCVSAQCVDGMKNGAETAVDCGGGMCPPCDNGQGCLTGTDCSSRVCGGNLLCAAPTCSDGQKNGTETDVDCGATCPACGTDGGCKGSNDCASRVCTAMKCQGATCGDQVKNGGESDVDCGGATSCPRCGGNGTCDGGFDCLSAVCTTNHCTVPPLFGSPVMVPAAGGSHNLFIGDLDLDGNPDYGVATSGASVTVVYGDGDGGFSARYPVLVATPGWSDPVGLAFTDLDGDGHGEIITTHFAGTSPYVNNDGCRLCVLRGTATRGIFDPPVFSTLFDAGQFSGCGQNIAVARIDADTTMDLLIGDGRPSGFPSPSAGDAKGGYFVKGNGTLSLSPQLRPGIGPWFTLADLNGDGMLDVASHSDRSNLLRVNYGDGAGGFAPGYTQGLAQGPGSVAWGHFNGDAVPDLMVAMGSPTATFGVLYGNDAGAWSAPAPTQMNSVEGAVVADFDGDGSDDIVSGHWSGSVAGIYFFRGHRNGTLDSAVRFGSSTAMCTMLAVGDFNKDGKPDVLQLGYDNNTYVYLNQRP